MLILGSSAVGQQDAMYTKYMFNPLPYNPAITGSTQALDMICCIDINGLESKVPL